MARFLEERLRVRIQSEDRRGKGGIGKELEYVYKEKNGREDGSEET